MTTPNSSGSVDGLAVTGVGPGTVIFAVVGIVLTVGGFVARHFSKLIRRNA